MRLLRMPGSLIVTAGFVVFGCGPVGLGCILVLFGGLLVDFVCHNFLVPWD